MQLAGGLYHLTRIRTAYNTDRGNRLTKDQARYLYETRTVAENTLVDGVVDDD